MRVNGGGEVVRPSPIPARLRRSAPLSRGLTRQEPNARIDPCPGVFWGSERIVGRPDATRFAPRHLDRKPLPEITPQMGK